MNRNKAKGILRASTVNLSDRLYSSSRKTRICWQPGEDIAILNGTFYADELEALAWWMRNPMGEPEPGDE